MSRASCVKVNAIKIHLGRKEIVLNVFGHFVELPTKSLNMINRYRGTVETEIESDCKERQLCMGDCVLTGLPY